MCNVFKYVIPANAGVILLHYNWKMFGSSYPRECGGDPASSFMAFCLSRLSPRMRG